MKKVFSSFCFVFTGIVACGGGSQDATQTNTTPTATVASTTTAPPSKPEGCKILGDKVDAFTVSTETADAHTVEGLRKLQTLSSAAATDLGTLQINGDVGAIAHDASTHLGNAAKSFVDLATILDTVQVAAKKLTTDQPAVEACALPQAKIVGTYCGAKTKGDCVAVMGAIEGWGKADKDHQLEALATLKALTVTDAKLKGPYGKIVTCVQPLADGLTIIQAQTAKLKGFGSDEDAREKAIDARFKTACGRGLFTK